MPYTTLVAGTTITASWANANVRDQAVTPHASSGARASAVTSPVAGMLSYLTGTKQLEPYDGSAWVPANGTLLAYAKRTSDKTFSGSEVGVLRLDSISMQTGYRYMIHTGPLRLAVTSGETGKSNMRYSTTGVAATTSDTVLTAAEGNGNSSFTPVQSPSITTSLAPGTVTTSILITVLRSGGSNNVTINGSATQPIEMYVLMGGPDPTDTGVDV